MQNITRRIQRIISNEKVQGRQEYAIPDVAEDMGIDIGVSLVVIIDIMEILPPVENISLGQFRLAIVTAIVRSFDPEKNDTGKVSDLRSMYERFYDEGRLTLAEMHAYGTMMYLLHPIVQIESRHIPDDDSFSLASPGWGEPRKKPDLINMYRD